MGSAKEFSFSVKVEAQRYEVLKDYISEAIFLCKFMKINVNARYMAYNQLC